MTSIAWMRQVPGRSDEQRRANRDQILGELAQARTELAREERERRARRAERPARKSRGAES